MTIRLFHQPFEPYAYAKSDSVARLVCLVEQGLSARVKVEYGDRYASEFTDIADMSLDGDDGRYAYFVADIRVPTRRLKYRFVVTLHETTVWLGENGSANLPKDAGCFQLAYLCTRDVFHVPQWVERAVCYQIFPERFSNGRKALTPAGAVSWNATPTPKSFMGGDLIGITEKLDYLHDLGVNLIYLTPIFQAGSNHKYDTHDYLKIDKQFGTKEDLTRLVGAAHELGIRVVLDAVFNHSGFEFAPFQDAREHGRASKYFDWFIIDGDSVDDVFVNYETFSTKLRYMPKLNVANPEVENFLLEVATYWIRECDIDGWRLDVANEVDHVFWKKFRAAVKAAKSDALIIGEVWHNSLPWLRGDEFDGVMNYLFRDLCLGFFIDRSLTGVQFAEGMSRLLHMYPVQAARAMFNLLGSHDTARILTLADGDIGSVQLAMIYQFMYPGIPMVYYGDEIGMKGGPDPDCRRGMVWNAKQQNAHLRETVAALSRLKATQSGLWGDSLRFVAVTDDVVEFVRFESAGGDQPSDSAGLYVAINRGQLMANVHVQNGKLLYATRTDAVVDDKIAGQSAAIWMVRVSADDSIEREVAHT